MYKGKFNQKQKGGNVQELLAQRNQPTPPDIPELKPRKAPAQTKPAAQRPAPSQAAPAKAPQTAAPQRPVPQKGAPQKAAPQKAAPAKSAPKPQQKKGPRLGGVIFYTLYFMFILVFFLATFIGLLWLRGWLVDFQASQPTVKSEQVFQQIFTDPDWDALYTSAGVKDSPYEGKEEFVAYMEEKIGSSQLTYLQTSAGLSTDKKFVVLLGSEKVASFTLVDKNQVGETSLGDVEKLEDLEKVTQLPDWQLGAVEVFFERTGSYRIELMSNHTAYVNGVELDESFTIQKATTKAEKYLPEGITSAKTVVQEVTGLMALPTVTVTDKNGQNVEVTYDEATETFTARTETNTITEEEKELARKAAETYCKFMIEKANKGDLAKYFETTSDAYKAAADLYGNLWVQDFSGYEFRDESITNYERYSDELFSVRLSWTLVVTRTNGTEKLFPYDNTLFFRKGDSDKWKVFAQVAEDVSAPQGQVRLTFKDNSETLLTSDFYETNSKKIITPVINVPEGKVFSGWVRKDRNAEGVMEWTLVFQPDPATGEVILPEGTDLLPMTLYPLFESPEDAAAREQPAETAPAEEPTEVTE